MNNRLDEVRRIVADVLNVDAESLTPGSSTKTVEGWDSIAHLNIIMSIEASYDLHVDLSDAMALSSIGGIVSYLDSHLE